jgi:ABC-2 type transport system ATP-binding protein
LILDEPFSGFDPINAEMIKNEILQLRKDGATIIFSTHNMKSVEEMCDKIALINRSKKILEGRVETIKNKHKTNNYEIRFEGNMISFSTALWAGYKLLHHEGDKDNMRAVVSCADNQSINDLLAVLIPAVKIKSVSEIIPSMNEIFIQKVREING